MPSLLAPNGQPAVPESLVKAPEPEDVPAAPEPVECVTAFVVYQLPDGRWQAADDLDAPFMPGRKPIPDEIYSGCAVVQKDALATEAAITSANLILQHVGQAVVQQQMQVGQQIAEARQNQMLQQKIEEGQRRGGR
jgi:hypothetical protein